MDAVKIRNLELQKDIAHTLLHRMSLWQKIMMWRAARDFRKCYDKSCEELSKEMAKVTEVDQTAR